MLDGHLQVFRLLTQAILAHFAILVQTITYEFLMWTGRCCLISILLFSLLLLAGNCLPFHQPTCPTTKDPKRAFVLSWFVITVSRWGFCFAFPWGSYNRPPLFAPSFTGCIWCIRRDSIPPFTGDARLPENTQPPSLPCSNDLWARRSLGCLAPPWRSLEYLSSGSGAFDPVKNGDAFETLGIVTTLADWKDTVKCCNIFS